MKKYFQKGFLPLKFCEEFVGEVFIGLIFFLAHHHLRNHLDSVMVKLISTHSLKAARNMPHVHNRPRRVTVATVTSAGAPSSASSSHSGTPPSCSVNSENPDYYYLINDSLLPPNKSSLYHYMFGYLSPQLGISNDSADTGAEQRTKAPLESESGRK